MGMTTGYEQARDKQLLQDRRFRTSPGGVAGRQSDLDAHGHGGGDNTAHVIEVIVCEVTTPEPGHPQLIPALGQYPFHVPARVYQHCLMPPLDHVPVCLCVRARLFASAYL